MTNFSAINQILLLLRYNQYQQALDYCNELPNINDKEIVKLKTYILRKQGEEFCAKDNYDLAIEKLTQAFETYHQTSSILNRDKITLKNKAYTLIEFKSYNEALEYTYKHIGEDRNYSILRVARAHSLKEQVNKLFAEHQYQQLLSFIPSDSLIFFNKAFISMELKKPPEALELNNEPLRRDPNYLLKKLKTFDEILNANPNSRLGLANKAFTLIQLKRYDEALEFAKKALELYPEYPFAEKAKAWALNGLGFKFFTHEKYHQALDKINDALIIAPSDSMMLANKAHILLKLENYKEALEFADKSLNQDPECRIAKIAKAYALKEILTKFCPEETLELISKSLELEKIDEVEALNKERYELYVKNKLEQDLKKHEQALCITPNDKVILVNQAYTSIKLGKYNESLEFAEKALQQDSDYRLAQAAKGLALTGQGIKLYEEHEYEQALIKYQQALIFLPNSKVIIANKTRLEKLCKKLNQVDTEKFKNWQEESISGNNLNKNILKRKGDDIDKPDTQKKIFGEYISEQHGDIFSDTYYAILKSSLIGENSD